MGVNNMQEEFKFLMKIDGDESDEDKNDDDDDDDFDDDEG